MARTPSPTKTLIRTIAVAAAIWTAVILFLLGAPLDASAGEVMNDPGYGLALEEVSVYYQKFHPSARDPLFWQSTPKEQIDLNVNTTLLKYVFWQNRIHSMTDDSQYHVVGWNLKLGARVFPWLDVKYEHFSQHILDGAYPYEKFPCLDSWGVNIYLLRPRGLGPSIF